MMEQEKRHSFLAEVNFPAKILLSKIRREYHILAKFSRYRFLPKPTRLFYPSILFSKNSQEISTNFSFIGLCMSLLSTTELCVKEMKGHNGVVSDFEIKEGEIETFILKEADDDMAKLSPYPNHSCPEIEKYSKHKEKENKEVTFIFLFIGNFPWSLWFYIKKSIFLELYIYFIVTYGRYSIYVTNNSKFESSTLPRYRLNKKRYFKFFFGNHKNFPLKFSL